MPRLDVWQHGYPYGRDPTEAGRWWAGRWLRALAAQPGWERLAHAWGSTDRVYVARMQVIGDEVVAETLTGWTRPTEVRIRLQPLIDAQWDAVIDALAGNALDTAALLAGAAPRRIEEAVTAAGADLFPAAPEDVWFACPCARRKPVCAHAAAACYSLSFHIDADLFLLLRLRGRTRDEIIAALRARRAALLGLAEDGAEPGTSHPNDAGSPITPLDPSPDTFWRAGEGLANLTPAFAPPSADALPVKQLGVPRFLYDRRGFIKEIERLYRAAGAHAVRIAAGRAGAPTSPP